MGNQGPHHEAWEKKEDRYGYLKVTLIDTRHGKSAQD